MAQKIKSFYENMYYNKKIGTITDYIQLEFQSLCKLRSYILSKKIYNI